MSAPFVKSSPCVACCNAPQGIAGHVHLRVQFLGSRQMVFRCERCSCIWARTGPQEGPFQWVTSTLTNTHRRSPGTAVPPRTDPAINPA